MSSYSASEGSAMRLLSMFLALSFLATPALAHASCNPPPSGSIAQLPPLMGAGGGIGGEGAIQPYYCAASPAALSVGDLSPNEWAKHVQVCTTNCSYEPLSPNDQHSMLIATACGAGYHPTTYYVEPPRFSAQSTKLFKSCLNDGTPPSKGAPPAPKPSAQPHTI
jgi:hypothetical protein